MTMLSEHYDELETLDLDYWWFNVRHHYAWRVIQRARPAGPDLLLDVGAGACGFLARLLARGQVTPAQVLALEASPQACAVGRRRGVPVITADLSEVRRAPLPRAPDVISMLDVLEHLSDPVSTLRELHAVARPGAHVLVLVPALQALWSRWDELLGHQRRYDRPLLRAQLETAGWRVLRTRYLFAPLVLPALLRERLIGRRAIAATEFQRVPAPLNRLLTAAFVAETFLPAPPFGTTLAALAVRREQGA